jgi:hypothetical protein
VSLRLSLKDEAAVARELAALRPLAAACAQQPDTEAAIKAVVALRDACLRAGETIREAELNARLARSEQLTKELA